MRRAAAQIVVGVCLCVSSASFVRAQDGSSSRGGTELAVGPFWMSGAKFGTRAATETTSAAGRLSLFTTSTDLTSVGGIEVRIGIPLTPTLRGEASGSYSRPQLRTAISGDLENAAATQAADSLNRLTLEGALVFQPRRWRLGARARPFVVASAGYLRELHEGGALAGTGQIYGVGAGLRYPLVSRDPSAARVGLRTEMRAVARLRGAAVDNRLHASMTVAASFYVRF